MTTTPYPSYPSLDQSYDCRGVRHSGEADFGGFNWDNAIKPAPRESQAHRGRLRVAPWSTTPATCTPWTTAFRARYCCWVLSNNIGPGAGGTTPGRLGCERRPGPDPLLVP